MVSLGRNDRTEDCKKRQRLGTNAMSEKNFILLDECNIDIKKLMGTGIRGAIRLALMNERSSKFQFLSPGTIQKIYSSHPKKVYICVGKETTIELGLSGDPAALRLCIERLVPKAKDKVATVVMPYVSSKKTTKIVPQLIQSLAGQEITVSDFKNLIEIFVAHDSEIDRSEQRHEELNIDTNDPNEAARIYAQFMGGSF